MTWFFFLLPIAALSGWLVARSHYKKSASKKSSSFNPGYFKGLNYLLNEQPDKAIDVFIHLLEVNSDTVATHLALATLFRRRGETERAIRIHQNLIARPTLTSPQRDQVLMELGLDYMHAGVLDRAEHLFLELLTRPSPPMEVIDQLLRIYQQEKEWSKAIKMGKRIYSQQQDKIGTLIAQFYCELAQQEFEQSQNNIPGLIKQAHKYDPNCVRASLLEAKMHMDTDNYGKALKCLNYIEKQNPNYITEALPLLHCCYEKINDLHAYESWLKSVLDRHPNMTSVRLMITTLIQQLHGSQAAQDYLHHQLESYPSVEGLHTLISLGDQSNPILVPLIKNITNTLVSHGQRYTCCNCSFSGKAMHWHCPGCKQWGTIRPTEIYLSDLETLLESST